MALFKQKGVLYALQGTERAQVASMLQQQAMLQAQLMGLLQLFVQRERIPADDNVVFDPSQLAFVRKPQQSK